MKLIKPKQISGEIMTLLDEADEKVIIVSPYAQAKNWKKLQNTFDNLIKRNIPIEFYYRKGENKTKEEIESLSIEAIPVEKLHCKIYMNEKTAVVASMNLYEFSDNNSLDIAYKTESKKEYKGLKQFYKRYIKPHSIKVFKIQDLCDRLLSKLKNCLENKLYINHEYDEIVITYNNSKYFIAITDFKELVLTAIVSDSQFDYIKKKDCFRDKVLDYQLIKGVENEYDTIVSGYIIKSSTLNAFLDIDLDVFIGTVYEFIGTIASLKEDEFNLRRKL